VIYRILLLVFGVWACSTAVLFIKASETPPVFLAGIRQLIAAAILLPIFLREFHRHRKTFPARRLKATILPGIVLGIHFITWVIGARMAAAANASLIVNLVPVTMPFFLYAMFHESPTKGELLGTVLAMAGILLLAGSDFSLDRQYFRGDAVCFFSMLFFCFYLALGRRNRDVPSLWLYVVPLYAVGGTFCVVTSLFFGNPIHAYPAKEVWLILGLGIVPTVIGHSILNVSMRHLPGQLVSIINMGQFISAGIMAYFFLHETPKSAFYVASVLLVSGSLLAIRSHRANARRAAEPVPEPAVD
jgi:drug/metabolite transporter (DMT)-like permease